MEICNERNNCIDLFKFIFSLSVVYIHAGVGVIQNHCISTIVNSANSFAVPFFFIASGFLFFRTYLRCNDAKKSERLKKYLKKIAKMYIIWSVVIMPFWFLNHYDGNIIKTILRYVRVFLFIGDGQLWYLNGLIIAIALVSVLLKIKLNSKVIFLLSSLLFLFGKVLNYFLQVLMNGGEVNFCVEIYYYIFGTTKNGIFIGFLYISIGLLIAQNYTKAKNNRIDVLFVIFLLCYFIFQLINLKLHELILPIAVTLLFLKIVNCPLKNNKLYSYLRDLSILIYLIHYVILIIYNNVSSNVCFLQLPLIRYISVMLLSLILSLCMISTKKLNVQWMYK